MNSSFAQIAARLYRFLHEIYGDDLHSATRVEIAIEGLSGAEYGTPHLEVTSVRVYAEDFQLLPNFTVSYWKAILAKHPDLFTGCTTHQDHLGAVEEHIQEERLYLEYELEWLGDPESILSPLCLSIQELRARANAGPDTEIEGT